MEFKKQFFKQSVAYLILFSLVANNAFAMDFTINTDGDTADSTPGDGVCDGGSGDCSIRAAIEEANAFDGDHRVILDGSYFADLNGVTLPTITRNNLFLDFNDTGDRDDSDGVDAAANAFTFNLDTDFGGGNGLTINADGVIVRGGLIVDLYAENGIEIMSGSDDVEIRAVKMDNNFSIGGDDHIKIGGTNVTIADSLLSNGADDAIEITDDAKDILIVGNKIGTDEDGLVSEMNTDNGIEIVLEEDHDFSGNDGGIEGIVIGGDTPEERNIMANQHHQVEVVDDFDPGSTMSGEFTMMGNYLGIGADGVTQFSNNGDGSIYFDNTLNLNSHVIIGSDANDAAEGNVIKGQFSDGISIHGGNNVVRFANNILGFLADGVTPTTAKAPLVVIESATVQIRNNIFSNRNDDALLIEGNKTANITIAGNKFGLDINGENEDFTAHNIAGSAIVIDAPNASSIDIGASGVANRNVIGKVEVGLEILDVSSEATTNIFNNYIGVEGDGLSPEVEGIVQELQTGILVVDGGDKLNIGSSSNGKNVISNTEQGVFVQGGGTVSIHGNNFGVGPDDETGLGNGNDFGIRVDSATTTGLSIGDGGDENSRNVFALSEVAAIAIEGLATASTNAVIWNNYFGVGDDGMTTFEESGFGDGIIVETGNIMIGGENDFGVNGEGTLGFGNVFADLARYAVNISGGDTTAVRIVGNIMGLIRSEQDGVFDTFERNGSVNIYVDSDTITDLEIGDVGGDEVTNFRNVIAGSGLLIENAPALEDLNIKNNYFGTDYLGTTTDPGDADGLVLSISDNADANIGGTGEGEGNLISVHGTGVLLTQGFFDFLGNLIGTDSTGTEARGGNIGIDVQENVVVNIGDGTAEGRNIISGNADAGLKFSEASAGVIKNNYIGTDITGEFALGNSHEEVEGFGIFANGGIHIEDTTGDVVIGTDSDGINDENEGNVISGNYGQGIALFNFDISNPGGVVIAGNKIGTNADGTVAIPNQAAESASYDFSELGETATASPAKFNGSGIFILPIASGVIRGLEIGSETLGLGNIIAGNEGSGIVSTNFTGFGGGFIGSGEDWTMGFIKNNYFGVAADGTTSLPNGGYNLYVNNNGSGITNLSVGGVGAENIFNNTEEGDIGIFFVDVEDANLATGSKFADLYENNVFLDNTCPIANSWWQKWVGEALSEKAPSDAFCAEPEEEEEEESEGEEESSGGGAVIITPPISNPSQNPPQDNFPEAEAEVNPVQPVDPVDQTPIEIPVETAVQNPVDEVEAIADFIIENSLRGPVVEVPALSSEAEAINHLFEALVETPEAVSATTELIVEVLTEIVGATDTDEVLVEIEGNFVNIAGENVSFALSETDAAEIRAKNPNAIVITPSTTSADGVGILFALMNDINPFEKDANGNGITNIDELFVHSLPNNDDNFDLAKEIENGGIVTNLHSFNALPVAFSNNTEENRIAVSVFGEDGPYDAVILKTSDEEFEEVERGTGVIEEQKGIYDVQSYLEDGKYFMLVSRSDVEEPKVYVSEFEVMANDILETSEVELMDLEEDDVVMLTGKVNKPGATVFVAFQSVIFNSVVIADANGEFRVPVPKGLPEGGHEVVVYAYEENFVDQRAVLSNISRIFFNK